MSRKTMLILVTVLAALPLSWAVAADATAPAPSSAPAPAARCVPADAILGLELSRPQPLLDLACSPKLIAAVTSLPAYQRAAAQPKFREMQGGIAFLEARLGVRWPEALEKLLGGGLLLTVHPQEGVLLVIDAKDAQLLADLHQVLLDIARGEAAKAGQPDRVYSKSYAGQTVWTFGTNEAHVLLGSRLVLANRPALVKQVLDLRAKGTETLASQPAYQGAKQAAGAEAIGLAFANLKVLKQLPNLRKALARPDNPLAALLLAALPETAGQADWLGLGLGLQGTTLRARAVLGGQAAAGGSKTAFAVPPRPADGALPNLTVPGLIASVSLYRDLHAFYAAKDELFPERTSGLIFFENMMGIFFSGRDLTDEVLAETRPEIRLVVARQKYDPAVGMPRTQLPGFAAVFHIQHPEKAGELAEEAWQKALGLVNFTRGQKAEPGLILDRDVYEGVRYSLARFGTAGVQDKTDLDVRFNFRPALARVGDFLVLSSTDGLAKDLIDALKKEAAESVRALAQTHSRIEVDGAQLAAILQANRPAMVRQSMVEKGKTQQQAENDFDFLVGLLGRLARARLDVGTAAGQPEVRLDVKIDLP
jgi:hypothetical protein